MNKQDIEHDQNYCDDCEKDYIDFNLKNWSHTFIPLLISSGGKAAGLALRLEEPPAPHENHIFIDIIDTDAKTLQRLGPFPEEEVVAIWRFLHSLSGLPLMSENPGGGFLVIHEQMGALALGQRHARRRYAFLSGRRPRFLTRRKTGKWALRPVVRREREIMRGGRG